MTDAPSPAPINPRTGLCHNVLPKVLSAPVPHALLYVGNSFFFFNNGVHRFVRLLLASAPEPVRCRSNMVAINGASLSWHDVESYFRPNAISSYSFSTDGTNQVIFRSPDEQLWDTVFMMDSSQGPIHPVLGPQFAETAKKDAAIVRSHNATPIFHITWAYDNRPEMTAQLADAITRVANDNDALAVPSGLAFELARRKMPEVPLYISDHRHPTPAGTYLQACTIIASLFPVRVTDLAYEAGLDPALAAFLRQTAQETADRFFLR